MSRCQDKRKFRRFCQAVRAADQYMEEMALVLKPMVPYRCHKHVCFHIGHDRWMSAERVSQFTISSRTRTRNKRILETTTLEILDKKPIDWLQGTTKRSEVTTSRT